MNSRAGSSPCCVANNPPPAYMRSPGTRPRDAVFAALTKEASFTPFEHEKLSLALFAALRRVIVNSSYVSSRDSFEESTSCVAVVSRVFNIDLQTALFALRRAMRGLFLREMKMYSLRNVCISWRAEEMDAVSGIWERKTRMPPITSPINKQK